MRKFRNTTNPAPGAERIFYGRADDPDIAAHLTHGIQSRSSLGVRMCFVSFCLRMNCLRMYLVKATDFFVIRDKGL